MGQDNRFICRMDEGSFKDAELIAAAPELLEACREIKRTLEQFYTQGATPEQRRAALLDIASAAIAKVEGKEG